MNQNRRGFVVIFTVWSHLPYLDGFTDLRSEPPPRPRRTASLPCANSPQSGRGSGKLRRTGGRGQEVYQGAIPGMLRVLDPHSSFFDARQFALLREDQRGKYYGVGMIVAPRENHTVVMARTLAHRLTTPACAPAT